ncbi:interleukin-17 receptor C isoform X1 [Xyrichtys novacula]|uniref:Interleukin-17 receptor C isoform X1 n=1 Tax=Xyrichtys novacula TaxID=13765 RepID=A0AAV1HFR9_XYRNO|nr:interleukin-17 receptor C isoform X1 [Xyrichtys novacula]
MAPRVSVLSLFLLSFMAARALEMIDRSAPDLTCSQFGLPDPDDSVNVTHVQLQVFLCCSDTQDCKPCLQITITIQVVDTNETKEISEASGQHDNDDGTISGNSSGEGSASVVVHLSSPGSLDCLKTLSIKTRNSSLNQASQQHTVKLLLKNLIFGSLIGVRVSSHSEGTDDVQNITIPPLEQVCSLNLKRAVKDCGAPRFRVVPGHKRHEFLLQLENDTNGLQEEIMFCMVRNNVFGEHLRWPADKTEIPIPSHSVAPCLCFQSWWKGKELRREFCPFKDEQDAMEKMQQNVSLSVVESQMREGVVGLSWNVTAPCWLEAEVWPCMKDPVGDHCEEVMGFRQRLHSHEHAGWRATRRGHWKTGEFNISSHPLLCIQLTIHGMKSYLEPHCPFTKPRWRWVVPLLIALLLICIIILGAYLLQGVSHGYVWRWLKEDEVKGAVGGGHVVLLYPPDDDQVLLELMSHLGSSLQVLGFSVSLDLWSQSELGVLGPVPWLHSRLNRLKKQGGKVVLVLTQTAWVRAEEWGARSCERDRDVKEVGGEGNNGVPSQGMDVFTASLSCILADYLQGRAGERFMLVQFESLPPEPPGGFGPLPELFRGLHVYSLPSQSLGFLTELAGSRPMATASARRKRAGGLRLASGALARRLSGFTAGTTVLRLAGVSQSCVGVGEEDSAETVPLQPCLITPPSSPDSSYKGKEMDWV